MTDPATKRRILVTTEGGVIQDIANIPADAVIEVLERDPDGDRDHPTWCDERQAFVTVWEGGGPGHAGTGPFTATLDLDGTEDELTIRDPGGRGIASITFWGSDEASRDRAHADARLIVDALNGDPHAILAAGREIAAVWGTIDVMMMRPDLDEDQSWEVLQAVRRLHRGGEGLNRELISAEAERLFPRIPSTPR